MSETARRSEEELKLSRAADERHALAFERLEERSEKVINDLLRGNREFCKGLTAKTDSKAETIMAELKDFREESQAQRQALLTLYPDRPPAAAAGDLAHTSSSYSIHSERSAPVLS